VAAALPEGLEFVSATDGGTFDPGLRQVAWQLGAQAAGSVKAVSVKARAATAGEWVVRSTAQAGPRLDARAETAVHVEGVPALMFEVVDLDDPIPVGKETTYEIRVVNQGTCACTNIQLTATLSEGVTPTTITAPMRYKVQGRQVVFEPFPKLATKADAVIRVRVRGDQGGEARCRVQLGCDQFSQPVVKEEMTRFYKE
jgi:uncharacterized repeat protein (TIGR01451 family)